MGTHQHHSTGIHYRPRLAMSKVRIFLLFTSIIACNAWVPLNVKRTWTVPTQLGSTHVGNLHGQDACFLPLEQLDQDYYAPRIVQIAGAYPGITSEEFNAVTSEPPAEVGQWTYDFSDPDGPQMGTVALPGSSVVATAEDPVVIIAEHDKIGVDLPKELVDPVDLIVLVDRAKQSFAERRFLVIDTQQGVQIAAFSSKNEIPAGTQILGQVVLVQIPWLPCMKATRSGFMEADEYF